MWSRGLQLALLALLATACLGVVRQDAEDDDDVVASLTAFDKAYDNSVVPALDTATDAAGEDTLGEDMSRSSNVPNVGVPVGATTGSTEDELASFKKEYDASVTPAFDDSQHVEDAAQEMFPQPESDNQYAPETASIEVLLSTSEKQDPAAGGGVVAAGDTMPVAVGQVAADGCQCAMCDSVSKDMWSDELEGCCPATCPNWMGMGPPPPPPVPKPFLNVDTPASRVGLAKPNQWGGEQRTDTYPAGTPYKRTIPERRALAKLKVKEDVERMAHSRAAVAAQESEWENAKLAARTKPEDTEGPLPSSPTFPYSDNSYYFDKRRLDTGPVKDVPKLEDPMAPPLAEGQESEVTTLDAPLPSIP